MPKIVHDDYGYADVLVIEYFSRMVRNTKNGVMTSDFFEILLRYTGTGDWIFRLRDKLMRPYILDSKVDFGKYQRTVEGNSAKDVCEMLWNLPFTREEFRKAVLKMSSKFISEISRLTADDPLRCRIDELRYVMKLTESEMDIVILLWLVKADKLQVSRHTDIPSVHIIAAATGMSEDEVAAALRSSSRLARFGLVERRVLAQDVVDYLDGVSEGPFASPFFSRDDLLDTLPMGWFRRDIQNTCLPMLKDLLKVDSPKGRGLNILLYGSNESGKTSFARMLASEVGRGALFVASRPQVSDMRCTAVEICNEQSDPDRDVIIVDDADAILCTLRPFGRKREDKGRIVDILDSEGMLTPKIWICGLEGDEINRSVRCRFDFAIRFEPLTEENRVNMWQTAMAKVGADGILTRACVKRLAAEYPMCAKVIERAIGNVVRAGATRWQAERKLRVFLDAQRELDGGNPVFEEDKEVSIATPTLDYTLDGLNIQGDISLKRLVDAVERFCDSKSRSGDKDAPRMNILLSGPAGSGKTEFVKYLSAQVEHPLVTLSASDLLGKCVGDTETNIARSFAMAKREEAILFLDEIDSFLQNRERAVRSWEVTQVNELLQRMEDFGGVMVGATNFADNLDKAVLRRFTFKFKFDYLTKEGKEIFFRRYFQSGRPLSVADSQRLDGIECLTPGDFRTVRQKLYYLDGGDSNDMRLDALEEESVAKMAGMRKCIGF